MSKIKVIIEVPKDNCKECQYLYSRYIETSYHCGYDKYTCDIFKCEIKDGKRCVACKSLEVEE